MKNFFAATTNPNLKYTNYILGELCPTITTQPDNRCFACIG